MDNYILEMMAQMGCGSSDTREIAAIVDTLPHITWDTLDALYSFGIDIDLTPAGDAARDELRAMYSEDDIECFAAYVNAYRNVHSAYATA